ncbi:isochorismatase family protein [Actinocrispum wychmicini]|uniref:Nicotinamidase-related amidase n=1 Tax=Actinocrispum wychmicini TaxID=1213861 RepID=A0A4R2JXE4_9PSEU|nr:isochorismatase family protein [Actinocrispum wychmicini]TCO62068.1 nicotinamidase-related amidase [Actinocrispum wychmicini]
MTSRRTVLTGTAAAAAGVLAAPRAAAEQPARSPIWRQEDVALLLVDYQPETFAGLRGADPRVIELNARLLARMAVALSIPVVLTTVGVAMGINGPTVPALLGDVPGFQPIDRSTMDAWDDPAVRRAVHATGRRRVVIGGLYSEICVAFPTVHMLAAGLDLAVIGDAIAGQSTTAYDRALDRMIHAGATASTAMAMVLEWFRDWASPQARRALPVLQWYNAELGRQASS